MIDLNQVLASELANLSSVRSSFTAHQIKQIIIMLLAVCFAGVTYADTAEQGSPLVDAQSESVDLSNAGFTQAGSIQDLVKIRCGMDGEDAWTLWTGEIYSYVPKKRQKLVFKVVGANVARCKQMADGTWYFTSREVQYYLDPKTGARLDQWSNPWTGKTVPVMHVANELVQGKLKWAPQLTIAPPFATLRMPINLFYPNRLSTDASLSSFSPDKMYQAGEFFGLLSPLSELRDPQKSRASMSFTWTRVGPWLPWMAMGKLPGYLLYSADGSKLASFDNLPAWLREELSEQLPLYRHAPRCFLEGRNTSSWTYFARHKEAYEAGKRFPLPAPVKDEPCQEERAPLSK